MAPRAPARLLPPRRLLALALAALCALGAFAAWRVWWPSPDAPRPTPPEESGPPEDPRLTYPTTCRNVRPDVKYVGDAACVDCHREIADSYRQHPMGRSLAPVTSVAPGQHYGPEDGNPFTAAGARFLVEHRGDRVFHRQVFPDDKGRPIVEAEAEVQYVIGSGTRTFSYLIERDGCVFESPITWYSQKKRLALSPGYGGDMAYFERPAKTACLFCHCNAVEPVGGTANRYRPPTFRGMSIGCERCHGPGELHVRRESTGEGRDAPGETIVNPSRLEPTLRDAVCEQCHLEGETRMGRRGRDVFDYRPGLPLHLFMTVFVPAQQSEQDLKFVSHVEQLKASRCSVATAGGLQCTICHDPHAYPPAEKRAARYREVCVKCHGESGCSLSAEERATKGDRCVACHMRRAVSSDIDHTAITDHRILRRPVEGERRRAKPVASGGPLIVPFHGGTAGLPEAERKYDLGLALLTLTPQDYGLREEDLAARASPLLDEALRRWPDDLPAREGRAHAREVQGRLADALADTEYVLAHDPARELSLLQAGRFCEALGKSADALAYLDRALAVNPTSSTAHLGRARLYAGRGEWSRAADECQAVLRFNPAHVRARGLLVLALARGGDKTRARAEFEKMMALKPPEAERLRESFAELLR